MRMSNILVIESTYPLPNLIDSIELGETDLPEQQGTRFV